MPVRAAGINDSGDALSIAPSLRTLAPEVVACSVRTTAAEPGTTAVLAFLTLACGIHPLAARRSDTQIGWCPMEKSRLRTQLLPRIVSLPSRRTLGRQAPSHVGA